jgi:hypothetical protein
VTTLSATTPASTVPRKQAERPLVLTSTVDAAAATGVANFTVDVAAGTVSMHCDAGGGGGEGGGGDGVAVVPPSLLLPPPPQAINSALEQTTAASRRKWARRVADAAGLSWRAGLWAACAPHPTHRDGVRCLRQQCTLPSLRLS